MPDGFALSALNFALRFQVDRTMREHDQAVTGQFALVTRPPEQLSNAPPTGATLTLYPYHLIPNTSWGLSGGPPMSPGGEVRDTRWLALDVNYLLAGYGPDAADVELLLGLALLALHDPTTLTPQLLEAAAQSATDPPESPLPQALRDLAEQPAPLKIVPLPMDLEALSKMWTMMNGGLRVGMVYQVGTLLLERRRSRAVAPGVLEARLGVFLIRRPTIARVLFAAPAPSPVFNERSVAAPGELVRLIGSGLRGDVTRLAIGRRLLTVPAANLTNERIEMALPGDLRPGLTTLQLVQELRKPPGAPPAPPPVGTVPGERSNLVPIAVRPVFGASPVTLSARTVEDGIVRFTATASFAVQVGARQRAELLLTGIAPDADGNFHSYGFLSPVPPPTDPPTDPSVATRVFTIVAVLPGDYLVRVVIDGAETAMSTGAGGYDGPVLAVPA